MTIWTDGSGRWWMNPGEPGDVHVGVACRMESDRQISRSELQAIGARIAKRARA